jgi:DNA replication protein DnaC
MYTESQPFQVASKITLGAHSKEMKAVTDICPFCAGSGWKTVAGVEHGVTRCDCRLRARADALMAAARIPNRYEHCELSNFEFDGTRLHLAPARMVACRFVEEYPVEKTGLLLAGDSGVGKTHLAIGIAKALIREKSIECVFYDYAELLKQIQESYNPDVQTTELGLLRPVFETEVLVLDDLGSVRPTEWRWDTIRLILNSRYNERRTTIITTNFADEPASKASARHETLGARITDRMLDRLHEMCRTIVIKGTSYRTQMLNANF